MADTGTEINVQRDWDFSVNLSGLIAPSGKGGNVLPTGYYKVTMDDLYVNPEKNANRVIFKMSVAEGPFVGVKRTDGMNIPQSKDDKVRYYWRGLAESVGYPPTALDDGEVSLGPGSFKDRIAHIHFTMKEETEDGYENVMFLAPAEWAQQKQNFDMNETAKPTVSGGAGSALGSANPPKIEKATSTLGGGSTGGNTVSKEDLLAKIQKGSGATLS